MWRMLLLTMLLAASLAGMAQAEDKSRPPNFVFLLTDDQRPDTIAALGNPVIETPHLDRLARQGSVFTRALTAYPLCVPSRAELLTGRSSFSSGVLPGHSNQLADECVLWPDAMRQAGYETWHVGKWHIAGRPSMRGYTDTLGLFSSGGGKPPRQFDSLGRVVTGYGGWVFQTDDRRLFPERGVGLTPDINARFGDAAVELIRRKPEKPFFLHVNFTGPHDPLLWPTGLKDKYRSEDIPLPPNHQPRHPFNHGNFWGRDELLTPWPRTPEIIRQELAIYYAVISHIDEQVGRIVEALRQTGQFDNTVLIFSSDHGLAIGSHGLRGKQNMYEHTIGVPMILCGAGVPQGERRAAQVYLRDLYPTVCEMAGVAIPASVEAKSFASVLRGEQSEVHDAAFAYFGDTQRMIRTDRWKLIAYPQIDRRQLFDLESDPHELHDLSNDSEQQSRIEGLHRRLAAWQRRVGDPIAAK